MGLLDAPGVSLRAAPPRSRPTVRNRSKLARFETALATKANPVITVLGNSITHGVGSNGSSSTTNGFVEEYRQFAWPVLLRKLLAARAGIPPCENFIGLSRLFDYAENYQNGAAGSLSVGPFGYVNSGGNQGGGLTLPSTSASADIPASKTGRFTALDVLCWGTASGTAGYRPKVLIDDVEVYAGGTIATGNLDVITISDLSDAAHKITLVGTGTSACFVAGVVTRRASGIVVNKIANPGMQVTNVTGAEIGMSGAQVERNVNAAICAGYTDLLIVQLTANEVYQQVSLTNYTNNMVGIITRAEAAGACVLLLGDPQVTNEDTAYTITGSQYRAVLQSLSDSYAHVAYADQGAIFGDRANGEAMGMWPSGTVHPSLEGHRRMADFILRDVLPLPLISSTVGGPDDLPYTAAEKSKLAAATPAPTPSTLAMHDANGNLPADAFIPGVASTATAGGTTTLDADSVEVQIFTGSSGQTVVLPNVARRFMIVNLSSVSLTLNASGGGNIGAIPTQNTVIVTAKQSTPTVAADWVTAFSSTYSQRSSATSSTVAVRDGNANLTNNNLIPKKAQITTSAGTATLTIADAQVQEHIGSTTHTTKLPTTGVTAGMSWIVPNNSSGTVTIQSSGANTIDTVASGDLKMFYALVDTPTTAAHWKAK